MTKPPQSNFALLRGRKFYRNEARDGFVSGLINCIACPHSTRPLLIVEASNSLSGLTALATRLKKAFTKEPELQGLSAFYFAANRFEPDDCHRSLGYYVALILAWLKHEKVSKATPIESRSAIYEGLAQIRRDMAKHRLVFIIDGIEADRGAFEDVLDLINDNPLHELIQNLLVPASEEFPDVEVSTVPARQTSSILLLSGTPWNQYDRLVRYRSSLPMPSPKDAKKILVDRGLKNHRAVSAVVNGEHCAETEIALLDTLGTVAPKILSTEPLDSIVTQAIAKPSAAARYELFRLLWKELNRSDPSIIPICHLVALCPGGLRISTLRRTLASLQKRTGHTSNADGEGDRLPELAVAYPMLFVIGDDEILPTDQTSASLWDSSHGKSPLRSDQHLLGKKQATGRERSIDIRYPEIRELIVAELLGEDRKLWHLIHEILAEEALDQWTDRLRNSDTALLNTIGGHRRLVQAIWHGMQSIDFRDRVHVSTTPELNKHLPRNAERRFLYISTYLMRRCLEWNEEWLLARGYSRHRLRVCLLAAINSPDQVREYLATQYAARSASPAPEATLSSSTEQWRVFFDRFEVKQLAPHMNLEGLNDANRLQICVDHFVSMGRAALESGLGSLAESVVTAINAMADNENSDLEKFLADLAEHTRNIEEAKSIIRNQLETRKTGRPFPIDDVLKNVDFGIKPIDFSRFMLLASTRADEILAKIEGDYGLYVDLLLRYAKILAMSADSIEKRDEEIEAQNVRIEFLRALFVYMVAEALRLRWRDVQPYAGQVSARPSRYMVRVSLKLAGLCYEAGKIEENVDIRRRWDDMARSLLSYAEHVADVYARRFYRYEHERAYMNVLAASIAIKRVDLAALRVRDDADLTPFIRCCFSEAFHYLTLAEARLSTLGFPLASTRRFLFERVKAYRAFSSWLFAQHSTMATEGAVTRDDFGLKLCEKYLDSADRNLDLLDCIVAPFRFESAEADEQNAKFWSNLVEKQRTRLNSLRTRVYRR
ncbi:hypothetical protein B0G69_3686 [Paraburkholderia sp. RAU2J]|uniref:hypothetical protein n=1 Tax=Paraburkholderia sp. RAU2J TaxID=1938810 RepID=UPI000F17A953|nr:hypothetical protein [Paraburkholderia sp. RAU2J]RKT20392.1 hypothetical protein B0G69_3686 [Paraburkholderia sp. RAU2J]